MLPTMAFKRVIAKFPFYFQTSKSDFLLVRNEIGPFSLCSAFISRKTSKNIVLLILKATIGKEQN